MNHNPSPASRANLIIEQVDGSLVIVEPSNGTYLVLCQIGTVIWQLLADGVHETSISAHLAATYQVSKADAQIDLDAFLHELTQRGLLHA